MATTYEAAVRRQRIDVAKVAGGWVATPVVICVNLILRTPTDRWWPVVIALMLTAIGAMTAVAVTDIVNARRAGETQINPSRLSPLALASFVWLLGGFFALLSYIGDVADACESTATSDFDCLHRPGPALDALGIVTAISATPALAAVIIFGQRSRVAIWISPALVAGIYMLALFLWMPHVGLGVPHRLDDLGR